MRNDCLPNLHPRIRLLLERCLEKEPKEPIRTTLLMCGWTFRKLLLIPAACWCSRSRQWNLGRSCERYCRGLQQLSFLAAIIAGVAVWKLKPPEPRQVMRFDYELPEGPAIQQSY